MDFRRGAGAEIDFATARAELMNSWASGLGVRFLTVMTTTEPSTVGTLTGNILSPVRFALIRVTDPGSIPTNLPVAIIVAVNCTDSVRMPGARMRHATADEDGHYCFAVVL